MKNYQLQVLIVILLSSLMYSCKNDKSGNPGQDTNQEDCKHYIEFFNAELQDKDLEEKLEYKLKYGAENTNGNKCYYLAGSALDDAAAPGDTMDLNEFQVYFNVGSVDKPRLIEKTLLTESRYNYEYRVIEGMAPSVPNAVQGTLGCGPGLVYAETEGGSSFKGDGKRLFTLKIKNEDYLPIPVVIHKDSLDCFKILPIRTHYYKLEQGDRDKLDSILNSKTLNNYVVSLDTLANNNIKDISIMDTNLTTCNQFCLVLYEDLEKGDVNISNPKNICFKN